MHSIDTGAQRPVALGAPANPRHAADHGYRADIDGLRGLAVIAVVLFHAGVPGFGGGFVGVDVFFIISGFLITSIIAREISQGAFSLAHFYERRVRRIFPALFTMLALSILPAYVLLPPSELKLFAQSMLSAALFGSNFFFWSKTGYFDAPAESHPLLHTWSLAIEEQFYLVFPLLFMFAAKALGARLKHLLAGIAAASLGAGWWLLARNPDAAFFLSPVRAWELLIGGLVALRAFPAFRLSWQREGAVVAGATLILASVLFAKAAGFPGLPFPGLATFLPCIGTALIIHAGLGGQSTAAAVLGSSGPVAVGKISYSWYLWHWPILVFAKLYLERPLAGTETAGLLALSIAAAVVSYIAVE
jgi:peptidoglycan/LPS O-acetylase OafA/YrhL